VKRGNT